MTQQTSYTSTHYLEYQSYKAKEIFRLAPIFCCEQICILVFHQFLLLTWQERTIVLAVGKKHFSQTQTVLETETTGTCSCGKQQLPRVTFFDSESTSISTATYIT